MTEPLFNKIGVIKPGDLIDGPNTPGQNRKTAVNLETFWVGEAHITALDAPSQWHHHKDFDSVMYMMSGKIRVDHGENGEDTFTLEAGDYAYFPRRVIHRCQILEGGDDVRYIGIRVGKGETVVNVDGPGFATD